MTLGARTGNEEEKWEKKKLDWKVGSETKKRIFSRGYALDHELTA